MQMAVPKEIQIWNFEIHFMMGTVKVVEGGGGEFWENFEKTEISRDEQKTDSTMTCTL